MTVSIEHSAATRGAMAGAALGAQGIVKRYGGTHALRGVSVEFRAGEVHAIVGENGAGKSTLTHILTGAIRADAGHVTIDGEPVALRDPLEARRLGIRMVHQHDTLVSHLDVTENILLGQMPRGRFTGLIDWAAAHRRATALLESLGYPELPVRAPAGALPASLRQVVELAKAVSVEARVLILDEPSAALAQQDIERLFLLVRRLRDGGAAIVYISHRLDEIFELADRVTVLRDGAVTGSLAVADTDKAGLVRLMVGRDIEDLFPPRAKRDRRSALSVRGLGRQGAFEGVSFDVGEAQVVGLYGLVGSGRTEVARCLFGADRPDAGEMTWWGRPFAPRSPSDALRAGVALLTEDRLGDGLVRGMSIRDNAAMASLSADRRWGVLDRARQRRRVDGQVRDLAIRPTDIERDVATLSGGNQQKVVLAKWLLAEARLLILDEPTRGVDIAAKRDIYEVIGRLVDAGMSVLLISSDLPEVLGMSDHLLVMREGRLAGRFDRAQASEESLLRCASGLLH
jgi:ribose transport system ATP-binding protein